MSLRNRRLKVAFYGVEEEFEEFWTGEKHESVGLFKFVARSMQFTYDPVFETGVSELLSNGTWMGLMGLLNRSEVDFVPGPIIVTKERWNAVSLIYPHFCSDVAFASRKPSYSPEILALFQTLSLSVWLSLLMFAILVTLVGFVALRYRYTMEDIIFYIVSVGLNQQSTITPLRSGEDLLLCTRMVAMTLFTSCFKSVLLSFLSFPPLTCVRNISELAAAIRAGKYRAMTTKGNYMSRHLQGSPNEYFKLIGESMLKTPPGYVDVLFDIGPNMAFVLARDNMSFIHRRKVARFEGQYGYRITRHGRQQKFCFKDEMDMLVHRFVGAGIAQKINRFEDFQYSFKHFSKFSDDDEARKITMTDILGAFMLLVSGYCLSVCMLFTDKKKHSN